MLAKLAILFMLILASFTTVYAANESGPVITTTVISTPNGQNPAVQAQVDQANRYLSAELQKQLKDMKEEMLTELKANQDANTASVYQWMQDIADTLRQRVVIGTLGACAFIQAALGFLYLYINRRYSYEYFLEKELFIRKDKGNKKDAPIVTNDVPPIGNRFESTNLQSSGMEHMQESEWHDNIPNQTVSMEFGQQAASQMTAMNEWQFQAPHQDGWKREEVPISKVKWQAMHAPINQEGYENYDQGAQAPQFEFDADGRPWRGFNG
jgi:hypothetical protein